MKIAIVDDIAAERTLLNDRLSRQLHGRNIQTDIWNLIVVKNF